MLWDLVNVCAICARWPIKGPYLCDQCGAKLYSHSAIHGFNNTYPFSLHPLFIWYSDGWKGLQLLLHSLKGSQRKDAFDWIKGVVLSSSWAENLHPKDVIVPSPPRNQNGEDHALFLARAVSEVTGLKIELPLGRTTAISQKNRSRAERSSVTMTAKSSSFQRVIFVDDVVTTGSTALAAKKALSPRESFKVLALACRPPRILI